MKSWLNECEHLKYAAALTSVDIWRASAAPAVWLASVNPDTTRVCALVVIEWLKGSCSVGIGHIQRLALPGIKGSPLLSGAGQGKTLSVPPAAHHHTPPHPPTPPHYRTKDDSLMNNNQLNNPSASQAVHLTMMLLLLPNLHVLMFLFVSFFFHRIHKNTTEPTSYSRRVCIYAVDRATSCYRANVAHYIDARGDR